MRDGRQVQGCQRQHPDVQRPAGRGAAPASRAGLGVPHRRPRQRGRGRLPDHLRQGAARRVDRHQRLRRLRVQPAVAGRLRRPGLPRRPDRSREQRSPARLAGHRPVLPGLQRDLQRQGLHDPARRRLPHGLLPQGHPRQGWRRAAEDLGRLPDDRREVQRPGPQRRRRAGLRLVHREEEGRPELLVDHLDRRRPAPGQGHQRRRVLRHVEHEPAVRTQRGHDQGARDVREDGDVRPAGRAQHGRRRHPRPVHDRALRPVDGLGRHRDPDARHVRPGQDRRDDHAGLEAGPRPLHRQARARATRPPARTPSTASTTPRSPRSAAGPAPSTPHRRRRTRTPRTTSCRT